MPQTKPIRYIFFDLGKVLLDYDWNIPARKILSYSPLPEPVIYHKILNSDYRMKYEEGLIGTSEFLNLLKDDLVFSGTPAELEEMWCDIFSAMTENIELLNQLTPEYPLGLISNTCESHIRWITRQYDFLPVFDPLIYSYEAHVMKPYPEILARACKSLNIPAESILFIDDMETHLITARQMGWHTIHLKPGMDLKVELVNLNIKFS